MATGGRRFGALLAGISLALFSSPSLAQLHSRPASVMLVATLESVSVSATPGIPGVRDNDGPRPDSQPVVITTSWAIPAHRTTLRLVGGLSQQPEMTSRAQITAASSPMAVALKQAAEAAQSHLAANCIEAPVSRNERFTLMKQGTGDTNRADSRTNSVNLVLANANTCRRRFEPDVATFSIRMEAL